MFSFTVTPTINITFDDEEARPKQVIKVKNQDSEEMPVYNGNDNIAGKIQILVPPGKKLEHIGIKVELLGLIELYFDKGNSIKFCHMMRELENPGVLQQNKVIPFEFSTEKPYETYSGMNVRLRYFVRVTIGRNYGSSVVKEKDFALHNYQSIAQQAIAAEAPAQSIKMEVGIEDCLHIEFEFDRSKYHLKDVILGKINFLLVRIKIKYMELAIIRREAAGVGSNTYNESENVSKFELMDGAPIKGEMIPIRLFLAPLSISPTYRSINNVFSVKYYLNLVLVDEEDRRYFKQQEVTFWRKQFDATGLGSGVSEASRYASSRMI